MCKIGVIKIYRFLRLYDANKYYQFIIVFVHLRNIYILVMLLQNAKSVNSSSNSKERISFIVIDIVNTVQP